MHMSVVASLAHVAISDTTDSSASCHVQVLIAWGHNTIVVAFRGTASTKNVMHDLQASQY